MVGGGGSSALRSAPSIRPVYCSRLIVWQVFRSALETSYTTSEPRVSRESSMELRNALLGGGGRRGSDSTEAVSEGRMLGESSIVGEGAEG